MPEGSPVNLSNGVPETVLPAFPSVAVEALREALAAPLESRKDAVASVVRENPTYLDAWAQLSNLARADLEAYAYARVGYHRGLDALRHAGWRGSGYVRWNHEANRGFLRCLDKLREKAAAIGETPEEQRCAQFLRQLEPDWLKVHPWVSE